MLRFIDGFDHYNTTADFALKWSTNGASGSMAFATGSNTRFTSGQAVTATGGAFSKVLDNQQTWIVGFAYFSPSGLAADTKLIQVIDGTTSTSQLEVSVTTSGALKVSRNGTLLATSAAGVVSSNNTWHYVELKVKIDPTVGTYDVHVDGASVMSATGQNTRASANSFANTIQFSQQNSSLYGGNAYRFDDLYIADGQAGQVTNFVGDVRVSTLMPTGAGSHTQWTPNTGTNFSRVNETIEDGDTSYISDATVGDIDTYATADLSGTPTVYGVQVTLLARKDDVSTRQIADVIRQGATDYVGTTQTMGSSYGMFSQLHETDPSTSAQWTYAGVNSAEFGVKVIA